ncbi:MAG TPA: glycosyltransferase family A protein [Candidatus Binataceae bacterium]|nr:glycosyltransferase family A protein [Candidatus Binataceae bacterium]
MPDNQPSRSVSVIIAVYNGGATVTRAIDSALAQHFDGFEIIAVNDGSTDDTAAVLDSYRDRIRVLTIANRGCGGARNAALEIARGRYLAFLDADDTWTPNKLAATVAPMERDNSIVLAYSNLAAITPEGSAAEAIVSGPATRAPSMDDMLSRWWPIIPSSAVVRRNAFIACGGFDPDFRGASGYEDAFLWLLLRERGAFAYIPDKLVTYRTEGPAIRMGKYLPQQALFLAKVQKRHGSKARGLVRSTRDAYPAALGYEGLLAVHRGDYPTARACFIRALRHRPSDLKTAMRLMRTFLPAGLARSLTGSTAISQRESPYGVERGQI